MRLSCDVDIVSRLLPTYNVKKPARSCRAQLSIGRKPGNGHLKDGTLFLMVCTAKDRNGTKFLAKGNIEQIFAKFIQEGKATVRMKEPPQDVVISQADPLQLKSFLSVLRLAAQGKELENITLSGLSPASAKNVEKPKSSLVILSRKDYPLTTNFPSTLEHLQVSECRMKRIDGRIFNLKKLSRLDLSNNLIETISDDISKLEKLSELKMTFNQMTTLPISFCLKSTLHNSLNLLDLSSNKLTQLPLQICELHNLVTLKVDHNHLTNLPPTIGRMNRLLFFSASNNQIKLLPAGFLKLRLESVDLFGNCFESCDEPVVSSNHVGVPDLMECCARTIRKLGLVYNEDLLHSHLCRYIDSARQCWCGNYCFQSSARYLMNIELRRISSTVTALDLIGGTSVPVEGFLCSPQCLTRFQNNPLAYWRK